MSSTAVDSDNHRSKRLRKGTNACWECKRRKVRCKVTSDNTAVCAGCVSRGTACVGQEYPEEHAASDNRQLGARLGRVEILLQDLAAKIESYKPNTQPLSDVQGSAFEVHTPHSLSSSNIHDTHSVLPVSDTVILGREEVTNEQNQSSLNAPASNSSSLPSLKEENLRQHLVRMLPTQQDADVIARTTNAWALSTLLCTQAHDLFNSNDPTSSFDLVAVSRRHPTIIARTLLHIAICIQQLPPDFNIARLHIFNTEAILKEYVSTVVTLVTSDDELVCRMEGLECLLLLGLFHINAGNLRRAWLSFRKALNIAQLMGFQGTSSSSPQEPGTTSSLAKRQMWDQVTMADRYLGVILGLPCGAEDDFSGPENILRDPDADLDWLFIRRLSVIAGRIIKRNQGGSVHNFASTQVIDEELESLASEMPQPWWAIPHLVGAERSIAVGEQFDRLLTQMWYFQLAALVHLPFMLRAATERRYEYSKFGCLKASRRLIVRYLALRRANNTQLCCRVADFGAFTATVMLVLGSMNSYESHPSTESLETRQQREDDRIMVQQVVTSMEMLSASSREQVASQSVDVIKTLLAANDPVGPSIGNLRVTIPHFGTINIIHHRATHSSLDDGVPLALQQQHQVLPDHATDAQDWHSPLAIQGTTNAPVISLTNSQFSSLGLEAPIEGWSEPGTESIFFDSLLNTDLCGNWIS